MTMWFSSQSLEGRIQWNNTFNVLKENTCQQPRILYPVKIFFRGEGKIKTFSEKGKRIMAGRPIRCAKWSSSGKRKMIFKETCILKMKEDQNRW